jgi:S1-C subfamily serine protease
MMEEERKKKKKTGRGSLLVVIVIAIILGSAFVVYAVNSSQNSSSQNTSVQNLEKVIVALQSRNSELEARIASGTPSLQNTSIAGGDLVKIYDIVNRSVVTIQGDQVTKTNTVFGPQTSVAIVIGSGFVINYLSSWYIVTNFHVVDGVVNSTATFWDGDSFPATVVGSDPYSDLAVVSVKAPTSEFYPLQVVPSSSIRVGQPVVAVGNPFGLSSSMTYGIVSQLGRTIQEQAAGQFPISGVIQFSAPINPGNSGGPLLNTNGMVVGITTAVVGGSQGVGFAIPSTAILRELPSLISTGKYELHPYIGIGGADMNYQLSQVTGTNVTYGVLVENVVAGGPAEKAGLKGGVRTAQVEGQQYSIGGDIIVSINGTRIVNQDALSSYLQDRAIAGQAVEMGVVRSGTLTMVQVVLGARPPAAQG